MFSLLRLRAEQREGGGEHKTQFKEIHCAIKTNTVFHLYKYILHFRQVEGEGLGSAEKLIQTICCKCGS